MKITDEVCLDERHLCEREQHMTGGCYNTLQTCDPIRVDLDCPTIVRENCWEKAIT